MPPLMRTASQRFEGKYEKIPFTTCWIWTSTAHPSRGGKLYGTISSGGKGGHHLYAHRVAHEIYKGPIPEGYEVDHLCGETLCVNPDHLEAVTTQTNALRSNSISGRNARKM